MKFEERSSKGGKKVDSEVQTSNSKLPTSSAWDMGSKWPTYSLKEAGVQLIDCDHKTPKAQETGFPYIGIPQMKEGNIDFDANPRLISQSDLVTWTKKAKPQTNDVILSRRCNSGETVHVASRTEFALGQNLVILRSVGERVFPPYLRWVVRSPQWWAEVGKYLNPGAIFESLKCADIPKFEVPFPPLPEQKAIAHILGSLDDKIELNRRMNATLEGMAQALFKSWFIDFDPVIDNILARNMSRNQPSPNLSQGERDASGQSSSSPHGRSGDEGAIRNAIFKGIPEEFSARAEVRRQALANGTANRDLSSVASAKGEAAKSFPAAFQQTESMGWIPEGWELKTIGDLCVKIQNGGTPKRDNEECWNNGTIPWLTSGEVRQSVILSVKNTITEYGLANSSAKWLPARSTVVAMYGATAGQVAFIYNKLTTNQAVCGLVPKEHFQSFNYLLIEGNVKHFENQARGSAQQNISKGIIEESAAIIPPLHVVQSFEDLAHPIFEKWAKNMGTNAQLSKLRDTLLPKLISGELSAHNSHQ